MGIGLNTGNFVLSCRRNTKFHRKTTTQESMTMETVISIDMQSIPT